MTEVVRVAQLDENVNNGNSASDSTKTLSQVLQVFNKSQSSTTSHQKGLSTLKHLHEQNASAFQESFLTAIKLILPHFKRDAAVERSMAFLGLCFKDAGLGDGVALVVAKELLKYCGVKDKGVRLRSVQLICLILSSLESDAPEDICDQIEKNLLIRLNDKVPSIRAQAVKAIERLQLEGEPGPIRLAFQKLLVADTSFDVRRSVIKVILLDKESLQLVIERCRDVKAEVRVAAFEELTERVHMEALTISQRIWLLNHGLTDRSDRVQNACQRMLCENWLERKDGNTIRLLEGLQVEAYEQECVKVLEVIFARAVESSDELLHKATSTSWSFLSSAEEIQTCMLTPEGSLFWRVQCQQLKLQRKTDKFDEMIPDLSSFCELVATLTTSETTVESDEDDEVVKEFVCKQLLQILSLLDLKHDEVGRQNVSKLSVELLKSSHVSHELMQFVVPVLEQTASNQQDFARHVCEVVSEVETSDEGLCRQLYILTSMLKIVQTNGVIVELEALVDTLVMPALQSSLPLLRLVACEALGLYCLLSKEQSRIRLPVLVALLEADAENLQVRVMALHAVFDQVMAHGVKYLTGDEAMNGSGSELLYGLLEHLDNDEQEMRLACGEGLAKLAFLSRFRDERVLQCLLVMMFHPGTEDDHRLRQCLAVFFPAYAPRNIQMICSMLPTVLGSVLRPPLGSPLLDLPVAQVLQYLLFLVGEDVQGIDILIQCFLCELMADPQNENIRALVKCVTQLKPQGEQTVHLIHHCFPLIAMSDKVACRSLSKWTDGIAKVESEYTVDADFMQHVKMRKAEVKERTKHDVASDEESSEGYSGEDDDEE